MARALYGPEGYYTRGESIFGPGGDFTTSPGLSLTFGRAIAHWVTEGWEEAGERLPVIELGAGAGQLAKAIREAMGLMDRLFLRYHIVEKSKNLRKQQDEVLGSKVSWHDSLGMALRRVGGKALVFSNEVMDAFPARVFEKTEEGWRELYLERGMEAWRVCEKLPKSTIFAHSWALGQRIEVHEGVRNFYQEQLSQLEGGEILTIDYGGSAEAIFHRRPRGTFRAYRGHQLIEPPEAYSLVGRQDLTCDVCFDDLRKWGEEVGLETIAEVSQREFLEPFARQTLNDLYLSHEMGPGEAFRVLRQGKRN